MYTHTAMYAWRMLQCFLKHHPIETGISIVGVPHVLFELMYSKSFYIYIWFRLDRSLKCYQLQDSCVSFTQRYGNSHFIRWNTHKSHKSTISSRPFPTRLPMALRRRLCAGLQHPHRPGRGWHLQYTEKNQIDKANDKRLDLLSIFERFPVSIFLMENHINMTPTNAKIQTRNEHIKNNSNRKHNCNNSGF